MDCEMNEVIVLLKQDEVVAMAFDECRQLGSYKGNAFDSYNALALMVNGDAKRMVLQISESVQLVVECQGNAVEIHGESDKPIVILTKENKTVINGAESTGEKYGQFFYLHEVKEVQ